MRTLGIVLIILGILALVYTGFTYTTKEKVLDVGPLEVSKEKEKSVGWPPIVGVILLAGGVIVLVTARKT
jgi:uncharacterized membrane protein YidH (DUF202 family)